MSDAKHHVPANDAPASEWQERLRGLGYVSDQEPKPVANYYSFHGFWVPPRVGPGPATAPKPAARTRRPKAEPQPETDWFETPDDDRTRLAAKRARLSMATEAGLMNEDEAKRQLREWAAAAGIAYPEG